MSDKAPAPKRTTYTLKKPHTHAGKSLQPGEKVELREDQAERLRAAGTI